MVTRSSQTDRTTDVRLVKYEYDAADGVLSIAFTYTPSVHDLAIEKPERMRLLLLGLVASLTEFSQVRAVEIDFGGQVRLGLGQCSDLLRTPQPRPSLLNDERLLDRVAAAMRDYFGGPAADVEPACSDATAAAARARRARTPSAPPSTRAGATRD